MFNKFKTQLSENSGFGSSPSTLNLTKSNRKNSTKKLEPVESGVSEDNQSSDDNLSQKSQQNTDHSNNQSLNSNTSFHQNVDISNGHGDKDSFTAYKTQLQELNQSLLREIDNLHTEINQKNAENGDLRTELVRYKNMLIDKENKLNFEIENSQIIMEEYENKINHLNDEKEELVIKNAELSEKYESLKLLNTKQPEPTSFSHSFEAENKKITKNSSISSDFSDEIKSLRDELNEKNKTIKNLQHRLNDLKKTLQKELKYHMLPNEKKKLSLSETPNVKQNETVNDETSPVTSNTSLLNHNNSMSDKVSNKCHNTVLKKNHSLDMSILHDDVNFKYLKHVVLKFLTSREYEAIHLVKALSVLLNLSKDEEKIIKNTLEWKMSWFGVKPK